MGKTLMRGDRLPRQFGFTQQTAAGSSSSSSANMANEFFSHGTGNGDAFSTCWPSVDNGNDGFGLCGSENGGPFTPSHFSGGSGGDVAGGDLQFPLMTPTMGHHQFIPLRCTECGIAKPGCEELEVHIKVEHLNWLPFVCPVCNSERASDSQMREHLHSAHRKGNSNRYIYLDNPKAKHTLQVLLDRALYGYVSRLREQNTNNVSNMSSYNSGISGNDRFSSLLQGNNSVSRNKRFSNLNGSNLDNGINLEDLVDIDPNANITEGHGGLDGGVLNDEDLDDETNLQLNTIFGGAGQVSKSSDFDFDQSTGNLDLSNVDNSDLLGNVVALFSSTASEKSNSNSFQQQTPRRRGANKINQKTNTAKKRVLGLCSRCQKPVTAGARQMHMYFHLSKDSNTYRFRCKFPACTIEHYRKDQMENHMVKVHGRIEPNLIEDRTTELFELCQKLSMETLGTTGNNPGPTAAEAQAIYDQQQEDFQEDRRVNKRKSTHQHYEPSTSKVAKTSFNDITGGESDSKLGDDQMIECKLCKKSLLNRIRGFHILWHMAKDMGINRYACKHCNYGHDRSQSVQRHGKLEHGDDNCCEDTINYHHQEIKEMSQKCFGIDALFAHDTRRPKKFPMQVREGVLGELELHDDNDSVITDERNESPKEEDEDDEEEHEERKVMPLKISTSAMKIRADAQLTPISREKETSQSSGSKTKKPALYKIFGRRKPSSRTKTKHVAKLRELSVKLGGALYYKRKMNEVAHCEVCGKIPTRMSEHVTIEHMEGYELWLCPRCGIGHNSREFLCRHIRDAHESTQTPIDNRFKWAQEVKDFIRKCYPSFFVNTPLPSAAEIRKLKNELHLDEEIDLGDESEEGEVQHEGVEVDVDDDDEDEEEEEEEEEEAATGASASAAASAENVEENEYDDGHSENTSEDDKKLEREQERELEQVQVQEQDDVEEEDEEEDEEDEEEEDDGEDEDGAEHREQEEGSEQDHDMDDSASGSGSGESNEDEAVG